MTTGVGQNRADLYARLQAADKIAREKQAASLQASRDRGSLIEALTLDGASFSEIASMLTISRQAVHKLLEGHLRATGRPRPVQKRCPKCRRVAPVLTSGQLGKHGCLVDS